MVRVMVRAMVRVMGAMKIWLDQGNKILIEHPEFRNAFGAQKDSSRNTHTQCYVTGQHPIFLQSPFFNAAQSAPYCEITCGVEKRGFKCGKGSLLTIYLLLYMAFLYLLKCTFIVDLRANTRDMKAFTCV